MFGAMHFIYYINRSTATKVDSTNLDYGPAAHSVYVLWGELGSNSRRLDHRVRRFLSSYTTNVDKELVLFNLLLSFFFLQCLQFSIIILYYIITLLTDLDIVFHPFVVHIQVHTHRYNYHPCLYNC